MTQWTEADIPDLTGRTALVTGANSGLGRQTAAQLARRGALVVLAGRDEDRLATAAEAVAADATGPAPERLLLDLADLASVRAAADRFHADHPTLDVLVNNAGVMAVPRQRTADGFERQWGTNHLGHFALTGLLFPALVRGAAARVVTVSSRLHSAGRIRFDDLDFTRRYNRMAAYSQSKLANLLFAFELDRRCRASSLDVVSVAAHPGLAATNLFTAAGGLFGFFGRVMVPRFAQSAEAGALPQLRAATAPDVEGGQYFGPSERGEQSGPPVVVRAAEQAYDAAVARRLWTVSEELTGVRFAEPSTPPALQ
ncbi:NAD(P)-dependent dehydrogenase (short-subunit alcohol dehydrogenase family) [Actinoalloteichus hoggarensis]|uniref:3-oxoacyl-[acyl-carrier-protein] reductase FabG n=1 Tax=Actinoalloteichus hoggarensis TaxID=1470176 RepID=A0A221W256_9PSEU|nr:oxidoreductase [Actinoalloteichus hoggarensis]ASO19681.1 3-oxoacyl-[acyl-carrier-protein] reductase FabG [Actinoalloteichus hoggarensis]MBB5919612.1 NAD(P)-dependent dehydrogenase (short-subunit alcohol dehydrogenase family) [Actinoalloteichus hoggarensis]